VDRYEAATIASVKSVARQWLPPDRRVVAMIRAVKTAPLAGRLVKRAP
jgi:hypothetical protein